ncbi:tyrosine-type recombinase/integrase [Methylobacterium oxalidis]|uniref:tyrosine-type recombinase/integrase n=1 Tax=Methylobacterium oxalidis TaxID=944322 RepID=UPI003314A91D
MRLTKPKLARLSLPADKSEIIVFDDVLPGFGIRLRAGGKRTWIVQYRTGAKQRRVTLGSVEVIDPDEARRHARDILAKVQLGSDPQIEKAEARARAVVTLGNVADRYLAKAKRKLRPRSYEEVGRHLTRHWRPLREFPLHKVQRAMIALRLSEIATENGPFAANRARASLSALFSWAMGEGLAELNPVLGTNKATEEVSRTRVLSDAELAAIWRGCGDDDYGRIVRLLLLTGQRREEVGGMRASEINADGTLWRIPPERTKNRIEHEVPLSEAAQMLIKGAGLVRDRDLLFGRGEGSFAGWSKAKAALDRRIATAGVKVQPWRLHDLRRTAATKMADELGVLPHVVEAILNHISGHRAGVAGIYNRAAYRGEKRQALDGWAKYINDIAATNPR